MPAADDDVDRAPASDGQTDDIPRTDDESDTADESGAIDGTDYSDSDRTVANESAVTESESADDEWRFSVEDVSDSPRPDDEPRTRPREDSEGNVAGSIVANETLESGDIDLENAVFVALGVFVVIALIAGAMVGL
jgi:hypothetical protein